MHSEDMGWMLKGARIRELEGPHGELGEQLSEGEEDEPVIDHSNNGSCDGKGSQKGKEGSMKESVNKGKGKQETGKERARRE